MLAQRVREQAGCAPAPAEEGPLSNTTSAHKRCELFDAMNASASLSLLHRCKKRHYTAFRDNDYEELMGVVRKPRLRHASQVGSFKGRMIW